MTDTQTVGTTAEAAPAAPAEAVTAPDKGFDLDGLLNEFDTQTKPATQPQPEPAKPAPTEVVDTEARRELAEWKFEREIQPVVKTIRGDIPQEVFSDNEIRWWLDGQAKEDPRLQQAWLNRKANPAAWSKVEKAISAKLAKKFHKLPDPNATEDVEAVTAAVRGASRTAPADPPPKFGSMSNAEYRKTVKEKYGYDPGV